MSKKILGCVVASALLVSVVSFMGCVPLIVGAAAGAGGYAWASGELVKEFTASASDVQRAAVRGLKKLGVSIKEEKHDRLTASIKSKFADGKNISIQISALTEKTTRLKIRVGVFGDKTKSEMVLNSIQEGL
jgi:hypothetical protein